MNGSSSSSSKRSLMVGFLNGRFPKTYVPKDYEQLQLAISQANNESKRSERKISALEENNRQAIEAQLDAMHQRIWLREWERLTSFRVRFQRDVDEVLQLISLAKTDRAPLIELVEQQEQLDEELLQFQQSTLDPIDEFCSDIQYWITNRRRDTTLGQDPQLIKQTFRSIKSQQNELLAMMNEEQKFLEQMLSIKSLSADFDDDTNDLAEEDHPLSQRTADTPNSEATLSNVPNRLPVPDDILEAECDAELKEALLHEFITLDDTFHEQILQLHDRVYQLKQKVRDQASGAPASLLQVVVEPDQHGMIYDPWKLFVFEGVYRRAPHDIPKSWYFLYIHFLHLMYPRQRRWELSQGASLVHQYAALKKRVKITLHDWHRAHDELVDRVRDTFAEIAEKQKESHQRSIDFAEQRKLCGRLTEQVNNWRRLKMEEAQLQHEIDMAKMAAEAEKLSATAEKEKEETRLKKEKIAKFKEEKVQKQSEELRKREERLAEVRRQLEEQAEVDWQRINFRKEMFEDKRKAAEEKLREVEEEEVKKEERLEALRRLVRVEAPSNLMRTMGDTENWKNHDERYLKMIRAETAGANGDKTATTEWWTETKPLFNAVGYSSKQIMADKRVQLEQRLRETGLIASEYGRQLIAQMKAPTVARRDQYGNLGVGDLLPPPPVARPQNRYFQPNR